MTEDRSMQLFFELYSGLPRQGPGDAESTHRALSMVPSLDASSRILDVGCGTGAQTFDLARATPASIVAVDLHQPFVDELNAKAAELGLADRVEARVADMAELDFPPANFDLVWSEGAVYFIGLETALDAWRPLLRPDGHIAVSELCWLGPERPDEIVRYFEAEYPQMQDVEEKRAVIEAAGYQLIGDFTLPDSAWWDDYYEPLERNLADFRKQHAGDPTADVVAAETEREIELFSTFSGCYGYVFFVMRDRHDQRR